jgi:hypothetical protein
MSRNWRIGALLSEPRKLARLRSIPADLGTDRVLVPKRRTGFGGGWARLGRPESSPSYARPTSHAGVRWFDPSRAPDDPRSHPETVGYAGHACRRCPGCSWACTAPVHTRADRASSRRSRLVRGLLDLGPFDRGDGTLDFARTMFQRGSKHPVECPVAPVGWMTVINPCSSTTGTVSG